MTLGTISTGASRHSRMLITSDPVNPLQNDRQAARCRPEHPFPSGAKRKRCAETPTRRQAKSKIPGTPETYRTPWHQNCPVMFAGAETKTKKK
ncbi:MAG: hypothetical protein AMXMBFR82_45060 [Candidatus Hydrogenedentota bacterium]